MEKDLKKLINQKFAEGNITDNKLLNNVSKRLQSKFEEFISFLDKTKLDMENKSNIIAENFLYDNMINTYNKSIKIQSDFNHKDPEININGMNFNRACKLPKIILRNPVSDKMLKDLTKQMGLSDGDLFISSHCGISYSDTYLQKFYKDYVKQYTNILNSKLSRFNADQFNFEIKEQIRPYGYSYYISLNVTTPLVIINDIEFFNDKYIKKQKELKTHTKKLKELETLIQDSINELNKKVLSYDLRNEIADGLYQLIQSMNKNELLNSKLQIALRANSINRCKLNIKSLILDINNSDFINVKDYPANILETYNFKHNVTYNPDEHKLYIRSNLYNNDVVEHYKNQVIEILNYNNIKANVTNSENVIIISIINENEY